MFLQTTLPEFDKQEFSVVRQHEEFVWLHDRFEENEEYAGFIVSQLIIDHPFCLLVFETRLLIFRFLLLHHDQTLMHLGKSYKNSGKVKVQ
jgi:hypothetical protein